MYNEQDSSSIAIESQASNWPSTGSVLDFIAILFSILNASLQEYVTGTYEKVGAKFGGHWRKMGWSLLHPMKGRAGAVIDGRPMGGPADLEPVLIIHSQGYRVKILCPKTLTKLAEGPAWLIPSSIT